MSIQTIIDNATFIDITRQHSTAMTKARSGLLKTSINYVNPYVLNVGMHNGLNYDTHYVTLNKLICLGKEFTETISLNNNTGMNYLTAYQGDLSEAQLGLITLNSVSGANVYINTTSTTGSGYIFKKGDYIQPEGNTSTYKYPYTVTSDVAWSSGNVTVPVHRGVLSQSGVALTSGGIKVGSNVTFTVRQTQYPVYTITPGRNIEFNSNFVLKEDITL